MSELLDLPNETLEVILRYLPFNDWFNVMLANRRLHDLVSRRGPFLALHQSQFKRLVSFVRTENATQLERVSVAYGELPLRKGRSIPRSLVEPIVMQLKHTEPQAAFVFANVLGRANLVKTLLKCPGVDPLQWSDGIPITWAAWCGYEDVIEVLLDDNRICKAQSGRWFEQAVVWACVRNHEQIFDTLLNHSNARDFYAAGIRATGSNYALTTAAQYGRKNIVRRLLQHESTDPSVRDNEPLIGAARNGHADVVRLLLKTRAVDPTDRDNEALIQAADQGHMMVVHMLLDDGRVSAWAREGEAVRRAAKRGHNLVVDLLLRHTQSQLGGMTRAIPVRETSSAGVMLAGCGGA
eukprot:comp18223_c0_seq1/m.19160 comp18223_c0_seq1/g.19160  ORF comp18223_c0_seq1/g.19160 comp18223_c0_seq1/m.19160 type:complete len:352 (-) comp18223_c0_seq1:444-1499(-)